MTAFYYMASEIKPGRSLTTTLTTDIPGRLSCLQTPLIIIIIIKSFINGITFIKNALPVSRLYNKIQEKTMILKNTNIINNMILDRH